MAIGLQFFLLSNCQNIEYRIGEFKKLSDYRIYDQGLNLWAIGYGSQKKLWLPTPAAETVRIILARTGRGCLAWQLHLPVETDMKHIGIVKSVQIWAPPQSPNIIINQGGPSCRGAPGPPPPRGRSRPGY